MQVTHGKQKTWTIGQGDGNRNTQAIFLAPSLGLELNAAMVTWSAALRRWATFNDDYSVGPGQGDWGPSSAPRAS